MSGKRPIPRRGLLATAGAVAIHSTTAPPAQSQGNRPSVDLPDQAAIDNPPGLQNALSRARGHKHGRGNPGISVPDWQRSPFRRPQGEPLQPNERNIRPPERSGGGINDGPGPADRSDLPAASHMAMAAATAFGGSRLAAAGSTGRGLLKAAAAMLGTAAVARSATAQTSTANSALVLYDTTAEWGWLGELYAIMGANLASQFGGWTAKPVTSYTSGLINQYKAVLYIGSTYDEPLPTAFLDDVLAGTKRVLWAGHNIWQLTARVADFTTRYGWTWAGYDLSSVAQIDYKGRSLLRYAANGGGIMNYGPLGSGVAVLGQAVRGDGSRFPWAVRSGNLTYIGEIPLAYISEGDRYLAFCDLLFDLLDPARTERHRGLLRIEDLNATSDPAALRAIADYLSSRGVPFGFTLFPAYRDPRGFFNDGVPFSRDVRQEAAVVSALKYMISKGGTVVGHGYTHQYSNVSNPYDAVSGDDFEFFRVVENPDFTLTFQGPLPGDSQATSQTKMANCKSGIVAAGLPSPTIWTFPHYAGSAPAYRAANASFVARWERSLYYRNLLAGGTVDHTRNCGQQFPFVVRDVYGTKVLPENIGCVEPEDFHQFPKQLPELLIAHAQRSLVVRDGFASFFFHPVWDINYLKQTLEGIQALGYTFVSPATL